MELKEKIQMWLATQNAKNCQAKRKKSPLK